MTDGRMMNNRPSHKLTWSKAPGELKILNHYVAPIPPIKFQLNLTYGSGGDVV